MKKIIAILTTAVLASALITGCSGDVEPTSSNSSQDTNSSQQATVSTDGSTSMEKVIGYLSEAYMEDNKNVKVTYNPTGSGSGIQAVGEGRCDKTVLKTSLLTKSQRFIPER